MDAPSLFRKRGGRLVPYNERRIAQAIARAAAAVGHADDAMAESVARRVTERFVALHPGDVPELETIQDLVETVLMEQGKTAVAKAYILYRRQRSDARSARSLWEGAVGKIDDYLEAADWRVRENANMGFSLQGLNQFVASAVTSRYWLERVYPPAVADAHAAGDMHIHDLGSLSVYCCGWDLKDLLLQGFRGVYGKVASGPPKHLGTALGQAVNFFYTLQGEAAGAQAFSNFDTLIAPFVREDGLTYEEVRQAIQEFVFNLNVPTRVGFQTPFTNLTMDLRPTGDLAEEPAVVGGRYLDTPYKDYEQERAWINRAFCEVLLSGDADGRPFSFPIPTYNVTESFPWDDPALEPVWQITARYGTPYFANYIGSDMDPGDARSMCCRLRLDNRELRRRGGGLFGSSPLTGSLGVVTLNLPRLGHLSATAGDFFQRLDKLVELAFVSLHLKRKSLEQLTASGLFPYSSYYLQNIRAQHGSYWSNHFSTVGLVGMHEACQNLLGSGIDSSEGHALAQSVLNHLRERILAEQERTGLLFNLEATPAEGTSYRLARLDKERFGDRIRQSGGGGDNYYTNSTHLPVGATDDLFAALKHQEPLQQLYTGGTVFHGFLGESIEDPWAARTLVRKMAENFAIPYFTLTPTFTICPVHGYIRGAHEQCPHHHQGPDVADQTETQQHDETTTTSGAEVIPLQKRSAGS